MPKLDRLVEFHDESRNYQVRSLLDRLEATTRKARTRRWLPGTTLDQGTEGACVGFSMAHRLAAQPIMQKNMTDAFAQKIYRRARQLDQWPGENYDGTSVIAGVKAAKELGYVAEYRWIGAGSGTPIEDVMDTLTYIGPIVFGLAWSESMFDPRPSGLMEVDTSRIAGGHAICAPALYLRSKLKGEPGTMDLVGFQNSWGRDWGVRGGMCYMKLEDVERLLELDGEGLVITKENRV